MRNAWRDEFLVLAGRAGVTAAAARRLLMLARRAQRLAEAACNGDWPADNGQRVVSFCPDCDRGWVPASYRRSLTAPKGPKVCPDCRCEQDIRAAVAEDWPGWDVRVSGDPRGCVVHLIRPGAERRRADGAGRSSDEVGVPS